MEIIEGLFALFEGCFCFLEFAALFIDGAAAYNGIKTYRKRKRAAQHGLKKPSWTPFIVLAILGFAFTALMVYKYTRPMR